MIRGVTKPINKELNVNIHNRFDIEVIDSVTGKVKQRAQAFNVICNHFWDYIGLSSSSYSEKYACGSIAYGGGKGTPLPSDTALFSQVGSVSTSLYKSGVDRIKGVAYYTVKGTLLETVAVGKTLTEVGFLNYDYPYSLTTHAMLQDMNGNPLSITKTATDIINIYATVYVHWKPGGYNGAHFVGALDTNSILNSFVGRRYYDSDNCSMYSKGGGEPVLSLDSSIYLANDPSTKTLTITMPRLSAANGNGGGFGWVGCGGRYADSHYNGLAYPNFFVNVQGSYPVKGETVGTGDGQTTEFSTVFDLPSDATVYVNGEAQTSGVTVKTEPLSLSPFKYLVQIAGLTGEGELVLAPKDHYLSYNKTCYFYNPLHELGLASYGSSDSSTWTRAAFSFSDDMVNWSPKYSSASGTIPSTYRNSKYIRVSGETSGRDYAFDSSVYLKFPSTITGKNIVFDEPPAVGSVITIDYITPMVPKDSNHVYDFKVVFHYGEYSAEQG